VEGTGARRGELGKRLCSKKRRADENRGTGYCFLLGDYPSLEGDISVEPKCGGRKFRGWIVWKKRWLPIFLCLDGAFYLVKSKKVTSVRGEAEKVRANSLWGGASLSSGNPVEAPHRCVS